MRNWIRGGVILAVLAHATLSSPVFTNFEAAFLDAPFDYNARRQTYGFRGLPIDQVTARLDQILPPPRPVALGVHLLANDFLKQRFTEALYPRMVDQSASVTMELFDSSSIPSGSQEVVALGANLSLRVFAKGGRLEAVPVGRPGSSGNTSGSSASARGSPAGRESRWNHFALLVLLVGMVGWGASLLDITRVPLAQWIGLVPAAAAVGIAVLQSVGTWFQLPIRPSAVALTGILLGTAVLASRTLRLNPRPRWNHVRARGQEFLSSLRPKRIKPESVAFIVLLISFCIRCGVFPLSLWDGRSIWLFNAKKVFEHGMFSERDLKHPEFLWSHPIYPLLIPSWWSYFSLGSDVFNERLAGIAHALLASGLLLSVWLQARQWLGRWSGAGLTLYVFLASENLISGGYVDPIVMLSLLLATLFFRSSSLEGAGWLLLALASLTKIEGLVFASIYALVLLIWHPRYRALCMTARIKTSALRLLAFVPAVAHQAWLKFVGVQSKYASQGLQSNLDSLPSRVRELIATLPAFLANPGYLRVRFVFIETLCVAVVAGIVWVTMASTRHGKVRNRAAPFVHFDPATRLDALASFLFATVGIAVILLMPDPMQLAITGFDRYFMTAGVLLLAVSLHCLSANSPAGASKSGHTTVRAAAKRPTR